MECCISRCFFTPQAAERRRHLTHLLLQREWNESVVAEGLLAAECSSPIGAATRFRIRNAITMRNAAADSCIFSSPSHRRRALDPESWSNRSLSSFPAPQQRGLRNGPLKKNQHETKGTEHWNDAYYRECKEFCSLPVDPSVRTHCAAAHYSQLGSASSLAIHYRTPAGLQGLSFQMRMTATHIF